MPFQNSHAKIISERTSLGDDECEKIICCMFLINDKYKEGKVFVTVYNDVDNTPA